MTEEDDATAGEYALGLLRAGEAEAFAARMVADPALRAAVTRWQEDLSAEAEALEDVPPPARVKARIDTRLFPPRRRMLGWLGLMAGTAAGLGAAALLLPPVLRVDLAAPGLRAQARVTGDAVVLRVTGAAPEGQDWELWWIAPGVPPVSLGLLAPGTQRRRLTGLRPGADITLAISAEPPGGSPTGQPTGPVLAAGPLAAL